jgi:hypothetical protein
MNNEPLHGCRDETTGPASAAWGPLWLGVILAGVVAFIVGNRPAGFLNFTPFYQAWAGFGIASACLYACLAPFRDGGIVPRIIIAIFFGLFAMAMWISTVFCLTLLWFSAR